MEMLGHMLAGRTVAAQCGAAGLTGPEMHPLRSDLDALLADVLAGRDNRVNLVDVSTGAGHGTGLQ